MPFAPLQLDHDRLWAGGGTEMGYFDEPSIGDFRYHSLVEYLPQEERPVAEIWGSGMVGAKVYFVGRDKLYCWDGKAFRTWSFPTGSRLFASALAATLGSITWKLDSTA
ncbi:MAG: hypothetical protein WDM96_17720 [Lacunisphaera sp.]